MTPEITDPRFKAIAEEIRKDPENASFTKRGIDPLFYAGPECRIMIVGQAPGRVAEESGIVWSDRSGDRLLQLWETSHCPHGLLLPGHGKEW